MTPDDLPDGYVCPLLVSILERVFDWLPWRGARNTVGVYLMEQETAKLDNPKANFTFEYGRPMKPHGWQPVTNAEPLRMMDCFRGSRMTTS
jgi:hypothetical protein